MERVPWISNSFSPQWMFFFCHIPLWDVGPGCSVLESLQRLFYEKVWLLLAALQTLLTALSFTLTSVTPRRKCGAPDRCWQSFTVALLSESTFFEIKFWNWTDGTVGTNFCADKCYWNRQDFYFIFWWRSCGFQRHKIWQAGFWGNISIFCNDAVIKVLAYNISLSVDIDQELK